ncbi:MAG: protein O-mannosyl-transferase family, partial [Acidobacteriota bacterium]
MRSRLVRILFERGGLLGLAVAALYLAIAPAHVIDGDNAEFCTLGALGGAGHPPGYPLFVLWLRAMSWLPGASPAHTAALATALLGALSIVVLHAACRAWGARPLAATLACAIYAGAPVVIAIYTEAEVFALNGVIVGGVLLLAARGGPLRGTWRAGALGLVAGLG